MTPRIEIDAVDISQPAEAVRQRLAGSTHSRLPAYEGELDNVVGIIQAKDVLNRMLAGQPFAPRKFVRPAPVIPESADALTVLALLKRSPVHVGLVHDEYGKFSGIVTTADILEAITGAFRTEHDGTEPAVVRRSDHSMFISGAMPADEFADVLGLTLPEARDFHTVAGFVLHVLGRIPAEGHAFNYQGWRFEIADMDGRRIDKIIATRIPSSRRLLETG